MSLSERPYLSIGEVLGLLLEEFPDVTISKIRFLESQGLIDPERTPSGYRKFYDPDIERLRVILREQRQNFLPLRVIRDRLESGEIDDTGGHTPPRGIPLDDSGPHGRPALTEVDTAHHPAARVIPPPASTNPAAQFFAPSGGVAPSVIGEERNEYTAGDICALGRVTAKQLSELESFGIVSPRGTGSGAVYSPTDLAIVVAAGRFLERGIEPRHLRGWRQAAEREAALFEQLVSPLMRQRNPQSRQQAAATLADLASVGAELRSALIDSLLEPHLDT
ncbi:MAG: MerR family transcriptional regulator [Ilumatobacteraceae bacterium]